MERIFTPLDNETVEQLKSGQQVLLNGKLYTGRDAAHKNLMKLIQRGEDLPFNLSGQVIYYVGPAPAKPGQVIGSAGPTTSGRMDSYTPELLSRGLKGTIGKGLRSAQVIEAGMEHKAVYFAAVGGAAALIARCIKSSKVIAYPELGPEAIYELNVEDFPVTVVNDIYGGDLYAEGKKKYCSK